jgi:hypothetical protein
MITLGLNIGQYTQEQTVTNVISPSNDLTGTGWSDGGDLTNWTQSGSDVLGGSTSYRIRANGNSGLHRLVSPNIVLNSDSIYTLSVYVKKKK